MFLHLSLADFKHLFQDSGPSPLALHLGPSPSYCSSTLPEYTHSPQPAPRHQGQCQKGLPLLPPTLNFNSKITFDTNRECPKGSFSHWLLLQESGERLRNNKKTVLTYWDLGSGTPDWSSEMCFLFLQSCIFSRFLTVPLDFRPPVFVSTVPDLSVSLISDHARYFHLYIHLY